MDMKKGWLMVVLSLCFGLSACAEQKLPPLPEGVDPQATPRVIVTETGMSWDGENFDYEHRYELLHARYGPPSRKQKLDDDDPRFLQQRFWDDLGIYAFFGTESKKIQGASRFFVRPSRYYAYSPNALDPYAQFSGYLEIDGVPIGPNMTLEELFARRKALGLRPLNHPGGTFWPRPNCYDGDDVTRKNLYFPPHRTLYSVSYCFEHNPEDGKEYLTVVVF